MEKKKKINWINGLKGIGCISVVFLHLLACLVPQAQNANNEFIKISGKNYYNYIQLTPINILFNGSFWVYIFWAMSAYVLVKTVGDKKCLFERILRKYINLFLFVIIISLIAFLLLQNGLYYNVEAGNIIRDSFWIHERDYSQFDFKHLVIELLWQDWFGTSFLIPPLWTIRWDIWGTILISFLIMAKKNSNKKIILILIFIFIGTTNTPIICFLIGVLVYNLNTLYKSQAIALLLFLFGIFLGGYPPTGIPVGGIYGIIYRNYVVQFDDFFKTGYGVSSIYCLAAFLILYSVSISETLKKLIGCKFLCVIGERSIYIYLCHMPVIFSLGAYVFCRTYSMDGYFSAVIQVWLVCLITIMVISCIFYRIIQCRVSCFTRKILEIVCR